MRANHSLMFSLLLACPLWLAACGNTGVPASQGDDAAATAGAQPAASGTDPSEPPPMNVPGTPDDADGPNGDSTAAPIPQPGTASSAGASDEARGRIDKLLGDADQYEHVFKELQQGVASGDRAAVATLMRYPLRVDTDGNTREIADAATFQREYDSIVTPPVARAITAQSFDTVFANWQGVMIGNGQVWLNGTCEDTACTRSDVKVVTIQQ